ncbi:hypothetical protein [Streptomyces sp. SPB074]|uniref:hypothetical protein n=1 Tax=Streptomyces sp. (strain SPB074) TaxID=465543 RepID=UPI0002FDE836|nr:hypothetical protein [Streptomyces sp. SPB074]
MHGRSTEGFLNRLAIPDPFTDADLDELRTDIERDVTATLMLGPARFAEEEPLFPGTGIDPVQQLLDLCAQVLRESEAPQRLADLARGRVFEGATDFGCLLNLGGRTEGARFWWQFGAGAGSATAAHCLQLLHLAHGELLDARHWALQAVELVDRTDTARLRATPVRTGRPPAALREAVRDLATDDAGDGIGPVPHPDVGVARRLGELAHAL